MRVFRMRKLNNKGVSLVTVIVCMLFAGVIAAGVLTLSVSNVEFTNQQKKNAQSNYTAEQVMDETKASIKTIADEAYTSAFEITMRTYGLVCDGTTTIEMLFKEEFNTEFVRLLLDNYIIIKPDGSEYNSLTTNREVAEVIIEKLSSTPVSTRLSNPSLLVDASELNGGTLVKSKKHPNVTLSLRPEADGTNTLIIEDVAFEYSDRYSNTSEAMTDLVMNVSFPTVKAEGKGSGLETGVVDTNANFLDWAIIADGDIVMDGYTKVDNTTYPGTRTINGNIYSGGNINALSVVGAARSVGFTFSDGKIVARGNLQLGDSSVSKITNSEIWVSKIIQKNVNDNSANRTDTFINGKLYIADNIVVKASNSSSFSMINDGNEMYFYNNNASNPAFDIGKGQTVIISGASSLGSLIGTGFTGLQANGINGLWIANRSIAKVVDQTPNLYQLQYGNSYGSYSEGYSSLYMNPYNVLLKAGGKVYSEKDTYYGINVTKEDADAKFSEIRDDYIGLVNGLDKDCTVIVDKVTPVFGNMEILKTGKSDIAKKIREVSGNNSYSFDGTISERSGQDISKKITGMGDGKWYISNSAVTISHNRSSRKADIIAGGNVSISMNSFEGVIISAGKVTIDCDFTGVIYAGGDVEFKSGVTANCTVISAGKVDLKNGVTVNALNSTQKASYKNKIENNPVLPMIFVPASEGGEVVNPTPTPDPGVTPEPTPTPELHNSYDSISIEYDNWRKY